MSLGEIVELNNGLKVPLIGFGTWLAKPGEVGAAVKVALETGYRHLDLARVYGNQAEVGQGIKDSGVPRSDIFITSKLWNNMHKPENVQKDLEETLKQTGLDYLDLYLMHFPVSFVPTDDIGECFPKDPTRAGKVHIDTETSVLDTWKAMIAVLRTGKVRSIGVSNCTIEIIQTLLDNSDVVPVVNQIERHPRLNQPELIEYCHSKKIVIQAYSPLGNNELNKPKVIDLPPWILYSQQLKKDPGQVAIAWGRRYKNIPIIVLVKSVTPSRIKLNFEDFELTQKERNEIDSQVRPQLGEFRANVPHGYSPSWNTSIWGDEREKGAEFGVKIV